MTASTTLKAKDYPRISWWLIGALFVTALVLMPLISVAVLALGGATTDWGHLWSTIMPRYLSNSVIMMVGVGASAVIIGTGTAWIIASRDFVGRRFLQYALLAPLAIPSYVAAYALVDMLEYSGPVQSVLRDMFGWQTARDYWFPEIRSKWAGVLVMSMALYPYIYLLAKSSFETQGAATLDVARALGCTPRRAFWRVSLPMARPAIAAGAAIVMMEVLNDFGTVEFFAIQTLTTGIFSLWLEGSDRGGAAQIAMMMLGIVLVLALLERASRRSRRFHGLSRSDQPMRRQVASPMVGAGLAVLCLIPVLIGFVLPVMVIWSRVQGDAWSDPSLWIAARNTAVLGLSAAVLAVMGAIFLTQAVRYSANKLVARLTPITTIGYAAPGAVLAIGILFPLAALDHSIADGIEALFGVDPGLLLTGTAFSIVLAYVVRFFAIAQGAVESAMGQVTPTMDDAARSLGRGRWAILRRLHIPLIRGSIATALVLIFVDAVKELPATLMLRPFNFDTLATRVYNYASTEDLERAAPAAIIVTFAGLIPVLILAISAHHAARRKGH